MSTQILLVEDDLELANSLRGLLIDDGYMVRVVSDGPEALKLIDQVNPDAVILDLNLPSMSGETVCREIKKYHPDIPILILTAKSSTESIVNSLDLGADDYITKPFDYAELSAHIRRRLRLPAENGVLQIGPLTLNQSTMGVELSGKSISLTPQEYRLLFYLMQNPGRVLTREMILSRLWNSNPDVETRVVDVYIGYLRKKLSDTPKPLIQSVRGFGYKIEAPNE